MYKIEKNLNRLLNGDSTYFLNPIDVMELKGKLKGMNYKIYSPTNISKATKEDYKKVNGSYYDDVRNTSIEDFKLGGKKRTDLCVSIPLVRGIAEHSSDENFKKELDAYLTSIQYDEKQVYEELVSKCDFAMRR